MMYFNPEKLKQGRKEVESIMEGAELLGVDLIRVVHKRNAAHVSGVSPFEIPKLVVSANGVGADAAIIKGKVSFYPDKNGTRHGFILDTESNRTKLISHLGGNIISVLDKGVKEELLKEAEANGVRTDASLQLPANVVPSRNDETVAKEAAIKEEKLLKAEEELAQAKLDAEELARKNRNMELTLIAKEKALAIRENDVNAIQEKMEVKLANDLNAAALKETTEPVVDEDTGEIVDKPVKLDTPPKKRRKR